MPAYQLYVYEDREKREALEQKICEQVDACTEVNGTIRNRIKKFLIEEGITDISEMDAVLRVRYEEYLERNETVLAPITCLRGFDGIVIHRMKEELQTLAGRRNYTTEYQEQWMCLTVLEAVQFLNDESEQVQFLTRLLSKVPFFNPIFPKAVMNDFDEMVKQKIDGIRKQKQNVEMLNDMFIRSIEEASFDVEVLSDMIYQKLLEE